MQVMGWVLLVAVLPFVARYFIWLNRWKLLSEGLRNLLQVESAARAQLADVGRRLAAAEARLNELATGWVPETASAGAGYSRTASTPPTAAFAPLAPEPRTPEAPAAAAPTPATPSPEIAETTAAEEAPLAPLESELPPAIIAALAAMPIDAPKVEEPVVHPAAPQAAPAAASAPAENATAPPRQARRSSSRPTVSSEEIEATVGRNWLSKIGIGALVIGLALLAGYTMQSVGPWGKILPGIAVALGLIGVGTVLERFQRYAAFARPVLGGGWALLYFVAYAAHSIDPARVIDDPIVGMGVLIAVAVGMIIHTLRYRSELITSVGYVLAFTAIDIGDIGVYSLLATGLLAASLVWLYRRFGWFWLGLGGVIATYLTPLLMMLFSHHAAPDLAGYWSAEGILIVYWIVYAACDFLISATDDVRRLALSATTAVNTAAFTALSWLLIAGSFPDQEYLLAAALAAGAAAASIVSAFAGRNQSHAFYGTFAVGAAYVGVPLALTHFALPDALLALGWMTIAAVAVVAGVWRRQPSFRLSGAVAGGSAVVAAFALAAFAGHSLFGVSDLTFFPSDPLLRRTVVIAVAGVLFAVEWLATRLAQRLERFETSAAVVAGHLATALLVILVGRDVEPGWVGAIWLAGAAVAFEIGRGFGYTPARIRSYALLLGAFMAIAASDTTLWEPLTNPPDPMTRWLILAGAAAVFYALAFRIRASVGRLLPHEEWLAWPIAHGGALLAGLLVVDALPAAMVAPAFAGIALVTHQAGLRLRQVILTVQAYAFASAAFLHLLTGDLVASGSIIGIDAPMFSVLPLAAVLFYLRHAIPAPVSTDWLGRLEQWAPFAFAAAGSVLLANLAAIEASPAALVLVWTALAGALFVAGHRIAADYRLHAYALATVAATHVITVDAAAEAGVNGAFSSWLLAGIPLAALLYAVRHLHATGVRAALLAPADQVAAGYALAAAASAVMFSLARAGIDAHAVVPAWTLIAAGTFLAGRFLAPEYRLHAYVIVAIALARLFLHDFNGPIDPLLWGARVGGAVPLAIVLYYMRHFVTPGQDAPRMEAWERYAPAILSAAASITLAVLARVELGPVNVIPAWSAIAVGLMLAGIYLPARDYRLHAYTLGAGLFSAGILSGIHAHGAYLGLPIAAGVTSAAIAALLVIALADRRRRAALLAAIPEPAIDDVLGSLGVLVDEWATDAYALAAVLLATALVATTATGNMLTISWAIEGLAVTALGFVVKERSLRLSGLALLGVCLVKGMAIDLAGVETIYRILSLILLGIILLGLSFAYARYRSALSPYLMGKRDASLAG